MSNCFVLGLYIIMYFLIVVVSLIVSIIAVDCLKRPVSKMTSYMSSGTLENYTH